jgi:hypothetical protein
MIPEEHKEHFEHELAAVQALLRGYDENRKIPGMADYAVEQLDLALIKLQALRKFIQ